MIVRTRSPIFSSVLPRDNFVFEKMGVFSARVGSGKRARVKIRTFGRGSGDGNSPQIESGKSRNEYV
jgi:hypothetical protein